MVVTSERKKNEGKKVVAKEQYKTEYLRHNFTEEEQTDMQKRLTLQSQELRHKENAKKAVTTQIGAQITAINADIDLLAGNINNGYEHRSMKCLIQFEWDKNKKYIIHPETGEVALTFDITEDDRQLKLEIDEQNKK